MKGLNTFSCFWGCSYWMKPMEMQVKIDQRFEKSCSLKPLLGCSLNENNSKKTLVFSSFHILMEQRLCFPLLVFKSVYSGDSLQSGDKKTRWKKSC